MADYRKTAPDSKYYDPNLDGIILSDGMEFFISWDEVKTLKLFAKPDCRLLDTLDFEFESKDDAKEYADEWVADKDDDFEKDISSF